MYFRVIRIDSQKKTPKCSITITKNGLVASLLQYCINLKRKLQNYIQKRRLKMSYQATAHYLQAILPKYQVSSKKEKSLILNHAEMATKLSRKHLIKRLSNNVIPLKKEGSGRPLTYNKSELLPHIKHIWMCMGK